MNKLASRLSIVALVCLLLVCSAPKAEAQIGPSPKQAAGIFVVLAAIPIGIGIGVYYLVRAPRNITGCVSDADGGLQLADEKHMASYLLEGDVAAIKPGERVHLSGKAGKDARKRKKFFVNRVAKDYGACRAATP